MSNGPIYVTRPVLPPLEELTPYLEGIWKNRILTNHGPLHERLEAALGKYLGVEHVSLFCNATVALMTALQALRVRGEVITTPYSFVATATVLTWSGIRPVFVDVEPGGFNLDATRIERAITPETTAILPVHCYGRPCNVEGIAEVARRRGLSVIYDAAHAFGVRSGGASLLAHGDLAVLSFHATKVFNTFEGGAIVSRDAAMKRRIDQLKNFGYADEVNVTEAGINGKMSEWNAAVGLVQLGHIDAVLARRRQVDRLYRERLAGVRGVRCPDLPREVDYNYAYFPILVEEGYRAGRDGLFNALRERQIFARRYFYPLITDFPMYSGLSSASAANLPNATRLAASILCLPMYPDLADADVADICGIVGKLSR